MKKVLKNGIAFSALLTLCLALTASAQQPTMEPAKPQQQRTGPPPQRTDNPQPQRNNNNVNVAPPQRSNNVNITPQQRGNNVNTVNPQRNNSVNTVQPQQRGSNVNVAPQRQLQRGFSYNPNRVGISPNTRVYRSYPGLPYGSNHITVRPGGVTGVYYNSHGTYRSFYRPKLGVSLTVMPLGYYPFYFGPYQYFYNDGFFYQYADNEYTVVEPPIGAAIAALPPKAESIVINGTQYYEYDGVYYQPITKDDGTVMYQVAGKDGELNTDNGAQPLPPQIGDIVTSIPPNCKTVNVNGQKFYVSSDGYYFQDATDANGNRVYKVAGIPTDEPGN